MRRRVFAGLSSVRVRATLAATLVVALALGGAVAVLVLVLRGTLVGSADAEAVKKAVMAATYAEAGKPGMPPNVVASGTVHLADGTVAAVADPDILLAERGKVVKNWAAPDEYAVAEVSVTTSAGPALVVSRVSLAGAEAALRTLYGVLLPGVPALLLVVAVMTWLSVGRALAPVAAIRAKVAHITARDLHQRVPVPRSEDEIAALATTVNGTLDRLETAMETHQRFVADAAHELRSPIATLRARLELAAPSELTTEALADVERLQALAADL
ncbi:MAG TPA: HAMP domain-containing protein, partial [Nonomuraea sp.]|nr:HAMP domain-containing protein [Nonomuraea sp.]